MTAAFRFHLVLIVLMNIVFVHITGAVGLNWIVPMYAATAAAPFLARFHEALWYRIGWNVGVIVIFAILLIDAMTTGITYLLEDGLILAAFCQVHLVNVIKRQTGADLLFFNSFLIALVTSLFCQDIEFSVVFAMYSIVLLLALHMSTFVASRAPTDRRLKRRVTRTALARGLMTLTVTAIAFAVFPRDFRRQGFVSDDLLDPLQTVRTGFSEEIRLGQSAVMSVQQRVVMRIRVLSGERHEMPELWRGATLSYYDKRGWQGHHMPQSTSLVDSDASWEDEGSIVWRRRNASSGKGSRFQVSCSAPVPNRLFAPLGAHEVRLSRPSYVGALIDGTLTYNGGAPLEYEVGYANDGLTPSVGARLASYRYVHREVVPPEVGQLLADAIGPLGAQPSVREVVQACTDLLSTRFHYLLPGERGAARDLEEFVSGEGGGHCEYFATALALMLRLRNIPCRVVTGFRVFEWDDEHREFVVRDSHAHAWVEVWDEEFGWLSADATPAADTVIPEETWWAGLRDEAEAAWNALVRFDGTSHDAVLSWIAHVPKALWDTARANPVVTFASFFAIGGVLVRRRRRRAGSTDRVAAAYERTLRKAGIERRPTETPREALVRFAESDIDAETLALVAAATERHELARYSE